MIHSQEKDQVPYFGFGVGAIGTGVIVQVPTLLLLVYMTDTLAIPSVLAGAMLFIPKLFDVITDPIMGQISDRTESRWGRRRPYLLLGAIVTAIGMSFLFSTPEYEQMSSRLMWVVVFYLLTQIGVTIFLVPYYALPAELTPDPDKRLKLMSYRAFFSFAGIVLGGVVAPWLVSIAGGGTEGYRVMSVVVGLTCGLAFFLSFYLLRHTHEHAYIQPGDRSFLQTIREQFTVIFANGPFLVFMLSFLVYICGTGTAIAVFPYYVNYILGNSLSLSALWFYLLAAAVFSIPIWSRLGKKLEKTIVYQLAVAILAIACLGLFLFGIHQAGLVKLMIVIFGFGFGGTQVIVWTILADIIEGDETKHKQNRGGIFAGGMLAMEKAGFALGSLVAGTTLDAMGYLESSAREDVVQSATALLGIRLSIGIIPIILFTASILIMLRSGFTAQSAARTNSIKAASYRGVR